MAAFGSLSASSTSTTTATSSSNSGAVDIKLAALENIVENLRKTLQTKLDYEASSGASSTSGRLVSRVA